MTINGIHHLAISTADMKAQIAFFTQVLGLELEALYWMHGVEGAWHGFLKLNDQCSVAFVQMDGTDAHERALGSSHAAHGGAPSSGGTMQHVSLRVSSSDELLAARDRIRQHGVPVFGPIEHGMCSSIYFAGPEGLNLEVAWSDGAIDPKQWIDPEVAALAGIDAEELATYRAPPAMADTDGPVPQPAYDPVKPHMAYPEKQYEKMLTLPDSHFASDEFASPPVAKA
ncbi:MAG: VOC family protein [Pontixanthobacter sp.]